jgi:hypothetical protein
VGVKGRCADGPLGDSAWRRRDGCHARHGASWGCSPGLYHLWVGPLGTASACDGPLILGVARDWSGSWVVLGAKRGFVHLSQCLYRGRRRPRGHDCFPRPGSYSHRGTKRGQMVGPKLASHHLGDNRAARSRPYRVVRPALAWPLGIRAPPRWSKSGMERGGCRSQRLARAGRPGLPPL